MKKTKKKTTKKKIVKRTKVKVFSFNLMKICEQDASVILNEFLETVKDPEPVITFDRDDVSLIIFVEYREKI